MATRQDAHNLGGSGTGSNKLLRYDECDTYGVTCSSVLSNNRIVKYSLLSKKIEFFNLRISYSNKIANYSICGLRLNESYSRMAGAGESFGFSGTIPDSWWEDDINYDGNLIVYGSIFIRNFDSPTPTEIRCGFSHDMIKLDKSSGKSIKMQTGRTLVQNGTISY